MIKAIIFDVDGVLMQSDGAVVHMFNDCLRLHGLRRLPAAFILKFMGLPLEKWMLALLPPGKRGDRKLVKKMVAWSEANYVVLHVAKHARKPRGIHALLSSLEKKYSLAVVTNESSAVALQVLRSLGLLRHFDFAVGLEEAREPKPSPAGLLIALGKCGCSPTEAVYVGDTQMDLLAGGRAGVKTVLLSHPRNKKLRAKYRLSSLSKLPALLKSI